MTMSLGTAQANGLIDSEVDNGASEEQPRTPPGEIGMASLSPPMAEARSMPVDQRNRFA